MKKKEILAFISFHIWMNKRCAPEKNQKWHVRQAVALLAAYPSSQEKPVPAWQH